MTFDEFSSASDKFPYLIWENFKKSDRKLKEAQKILQGVVDKAKHGYKFTIGNVYQFARDLGQHITRATSDYLGHNVLGSVLYNQALVVGRLYDKEGKLTPDAIETVMHEIGHNLLFTKAGREPWKRIAGKELIRGEWKYVESMINKYNTQSWGKKRTYYTQQTERYARLFVLYMLDNARLKQLCPVLYDKMEKTILESAPCSWPRMNRAC